MHYCYFLIERDLIYLDSGQGSDAPRSSYPGQRPDPKLGLEKQGNKDPRAQAHQDDMEVGYEDNNLPQTFEGLEQKFIQDLMKLTKEQHDAEDAENARHREVGSTIILRSKHMRVTFRNSGYKFFHCPNSDKGANISTIFIKIYF